ncbi:scopoletin 8-hydroxylase-like [Apium graveolens]|uniref:scopoletin 8-hydroxylase-like n=1 Tax=Apium graveolens TaxID=4045 RepID=UPI003D7987B1
MAPSFDNADLYNFVVRQGNGVKGLVDSGVSKVPERYIQLPSERILKPDGYKSHQHSPIDLSKLEGPEHDKVVHDIARAAETLGFFQVVNHGVPLELLEALKTAAHKFFNQPAEKKAVYLKGVSPSPSVKYGTSFVPEKEKALEWKDYISMVYTNDDEAQQFWPHDCREVALEYLKTSMDMVKTILRILFENLGVTLQESKIDGLVGLKMVNMNYYPACPDPDLTVGVGRHSDVGMLTVLLQDGIGGLYVRQEGTTKCDDEWLEIPPVSGALVINVGDALQILSNGKYLSAEHRVRTTGKQSRVSIPIFTTPNLGENIGPFPQLVEHHGVAHYRDVLFGDYMTNFFGKAHEGKKSLEFVEKSKTGV